MVLGAGLLAPLTSLPQALMVYAGAALFPWTVALVALARMANIPRSGVKAVIVVNIAWIVASIAVLFVTSPTIFGYGFVIAQAVAVGLFAQLQIVALKREAHAA